MTLPDPRFMTNLQRLLLEGEYVGTYKYALLISIARWAVENPHWEEGRELDVAALAPHFLELYWPQAKPFAVADRVQEPGLPYGDWEDPELAGVLLQDRGQRQARQAPRILKEILRAYRECGGVLSKLDPGARIALERSVRKTIRDMPLWKLQTLRSSQKPAEVLYHPGRNGYHLRFAPGVAASFAHFAPLVEEIARSAWLRHVLRSNPGLLGAHARVESFLFPDARNGLRLLRAPLLEAQGDRCFYCDGSLRRSMAVDHFLPWARYRRDLGHNFVLAHQRCNSSKSDTLAGLPHLERWVERNQLHGEVLGSRFDDLRIPHDQRLVQRVATSLYELAEAEGADLWLGPGSMAVIQPEWRQILGAVG